MLFYDLTICLLVFCFLPNQVKKYRSFLKTLTLCVCVFFLIVTEYEGHALSLLKECELQGFDGYVILFIYICHIVIKCFH